MKPARFALLAASGMAVTSLGVWYATGSAHGSLDSDRQRPVSVANPRPAVDPPVLPAVDRSSFQVGDTLMMEARLGHAVMRSDIDNETFVSIAVNADASKRASRPTPLSLAIVIDRSGSMKGARLTNALAAARTAVDRLRDGDQVSVIAYNTTSQILVAPTVITATNRPSVKAALSGLKARGDTCISCGITDAMRLAGSGNASVRRMLLLSDGEATAGVRDDDGFRRLAETCRDMGIAVTTIGVDISYNERIMAAIARESNGRHHFVQTASALPAIFDQEMETLTRTVATNTELTIDLAPGVFVDHIFDRTFTRRGEQIVVPLGSFAAADRKTLLLRVRLPRGGSGERAVAGVALRYDDLADDKAGLCNGQLIARLTADPAEATPLDGLVSARLSRSEAAESLQEANKLFAAGRREDARGVIANTRAQIAARGRAARDAVPAERQRELGDDFAAQEKTLGGSKEGFEAEATPTAGAVQTRRNADDALDLSE